MALPERSLMVGAPGQAVGDDLRDALERVGRLLAVRARSEAELRAAMERWELAGGLVEDAIAKLKDLWLVDDLAFAREWVEERGRRKGLGSQRLLSELSLKGLDPEIARQAVEEVGLDDEVQAREVAAKLVGRVAGRPLAQQGMRLQRMLLSRGFELDVALPAVRSVLPPEGWD